VIGEMGGWIGDEDRLGKLEGWVGAMRLVVHNDQGGRNG
jgi:hypothetical protein